MDPYPTGSAEESFPDLWCAALSHCMERFEGARPKYHDVRSGGVGAFTADNFPVFDYMRPNVFVVADSNHGYKMIAVGREVANVVLGEHSSLLHPFRYERFATGDLHPVSHSPYPWTSSTRRSRTSPRSTATARSSTRKELTTRKINAELRRLRLRAGHQGRHDPQPERAALASASGILTRCKITFEGSLGYFGVGLIDGPEIQINGRVGWSVAENMMSGVVVIESNAGSLAGAALRGGDLVVKGQVGARTGIDQKGGTIVVMGDAGSMTGFMMQRGRQIICGDVGPGLGDSMYDGTLYVAGKVKALGIDCVEGEWDRRRHRADRAQVPHLRPRRPAAVPEVRLRKEALQLRQPRAERAKAGAVMARTRTHPARRPSSAAARSSRRRSSTTST